MTTTTETVYCAGCGDEVASVDEKTECGPCCHNLPQRWSRTSEGFYTGTPGEEDHYDDDEDDEVHAPTCSQCGSHRFTITTTTTIDCSEYEESPETIYFDGNNYGDATVVCENCGIVPRVDLEIE